MFFLCLHLVISFAEKWELLKCGLFCCYWRFFVCWGFGLFLFGLGFLADWVFFFVCLLFLFLKVTPPIDLREYPTLKEICASKPLKIICIYVADLHGGMIQNLCLFGKSNKPSSAQWQTGTIVEMGIYRLQGKLVGFYFKNSKLVLISRSYKCSVTINSKLPWLSICFFFFFFSGA